jgi:uncharacterized protein YaeQ
MIEHYISKRLLKYVNINVVWWIELGNDPASRYHWTSIRCFEVLKLHNNIF